MLPDVTVRASGSSVNVQLASPLLDLDCQIALCCTPSIWPRRDVPG